MGWRHGVYLMSGIAAGGLLAELTWAVADRIHLHLVDRGVRLVDRAHELVHL